MPRARAATLALQMNWACERTRHRDGSRPTAGGPLNSYQRMPCHTPNPIPWNIRPPGSATTDPERSPNASIPQTSPIYTRLAGPLSHGSSRPSRNTVASNGLHSNLPTSQRARDTSDRTHNPCLTERVARSRRATRTWWTWTQVERQDHRQ